MDGKAGSLAIAGDRFYFFFFIVLAGEDVAVQVCPVLTPWWQGGDMKEMFELQQRTQAQGCTRHASAQRRMTKLLCGSSEPNVGSQGWGFLGCFGLSGPLPDLLLWGLGEHKL